MHFQQQIRIPYINLRSSILDDFDRLINSFFGESPLAPARTNLSSRIPAVDVRETDDAYVLEAELPGFDEKSVEVHVDGQVLTNRLLTLNIQKRAESKRNLIKIEG